MHITDDEKAQILNQRLKQFAAEKYQHEINAEVSAALDDEAGAAAAAQAIATLDAAIAVHESRLSDLNT
jgi:hypothetical protein